VLASVITNMMATASFYQGFQAFFLPILSTFGWTRTQISGAFALRQVESGLLGPGVGFLVDSLGARWIIIVGGIVAGLGVILISLTQNLGMFYVAFLLTSIGTSGTSHAVTWPTIIARWFTRRRGVAIGLATFGPIVGVAFIVPNTFFEAYFGWRPTLFVYGILMAIVTVAMGLIARDWPERYGYLPDGRSFSKSPLNGGPELSGSPQAVDGMTWIQAVHTSQFWALWVFLAVMFMGSSGFQTHQVAYFESVGMSTAAAASTVVMAVLFSGIGRLGTGAVLDIVDHRVVMLCMVLMMAAGFVYLYIIPVHSLAMALPFGALFGISFGGSIPARGILGSFMFGTRNVGAIIGLLQGSSILAGIVSPILLGAVFDATGSYHLGLIILAGLTLGGLPLLWWMGPSRRL
jgi:MFS family permease